MDEKVLDYLCEYEKLMISEAKEKLRESELYQQYYVERKRLSDETAARIAAKQPLSDPVLLVDARKLEVLGKRLLQYMWELDPYDVD